MCKISDQASKFILAENKELQFNSCEKVFNRNIMLVGSVGTGKTRSVIKPNIMQMNGNYVVLDANGTLVLELGNMLESNGYKVKVLNLADPVHSDTYNPFCYMKSDADVFNFVDCMLAHYDLLCPSAGEKYDSCLIQGVKALLSAIFFYLRHECNTEDKNLFSVLKVLHCHNVADDFDVIGPSIESTLDIMMKDLKMINDEHIAVKQYDIFKSVSVSPYTEARILATAHFCMQSFNLEAYSNLTSANSIDFEDFSCSKTALFVIPPSSKSSFSWFLGAFFNQLFDHIMNSENLYSTQFIFDDFVYAGSIHNFECKMTLLQNKEPHCSFIISIQDEVQLKNEYGLAADSIINRCDNYIFMGSRNIELCEKVAKYFSESSTSAQDLLCISRDKCVVISGGNAEIFNKYDLKTHPWYEDIADMAAKDDPTAASLVYDLSKKIVEKINPPDVVEEPSDTESEQSEQMDQERQYVRPVITHNENDQSHLSVVPHMGDTHSPDDLLKLYQEFYVPEEECKCLSEEEYSSLVGDMKKTGIRAWEIGTKYSPYTNSNTITAVLLGDDDDLCLYIKGSGQTESFSIFNRPPWYNEYRLKIKKIVIKNGISQLGNYLFSDLPCLTEVEIPSSVTGFGTSLFADCLSLSNVTIASGYYSNECSVAEKMFENDISLQEVKLPSQFTKIETLAFSGCSGLKTVVLPDNLSYIHPFAFRDCPALCDVRSYDLGAAIAGLPSHIQSYINNFGVVLKRAEGTEISSKKYQIMEDSIIFDQIIAPTSFRKILHNALAEYFYFKFELSSDSSDYYHQYRYNTYRDLLPEVRSYCNMIGLFNTQDLEDVFKNDLTHFQYFLFCGFRFKDNRYCKIKNKRNRAPQYFSTVESYYDFISNIHFWIFAMTIWEDLFSIIQSSLGDDPSSAKRLALKKLREELISKTGIEISDTAFKAILDSLNSDGLILMSKKGSSYFFSLPQDSFGSVSEGNNGECFDQASVGKVTEPE